MFEPRSACFCAAKYWAEGNTCSTIRKNIPQTLQSLRLIVLHWKGGVKFSKRHLCTEQTDLDQRHQQPSYIRGLPNRVDKSFFKKWFKNNSVLLSSEGCSSPVWNSQHPLQSHHDFRNVFCDLHVVSLLLMSNVLIHYYLIYWQCLWSPWMLWVVWLELWEHCLLLLFCSMSKIL